METAITDGGEDTENEVATDGGQPADGETTDAETGAENADAGGDTEQSGS
jgi:hypothetical protein